MTYSSPAWSVPKPVMLNGVSTSSRCQVAFWPSCLIPQTRPVDQSP